MGTDNEDFTSREESEGKSFPGYSSSESGGSNGGLDTENELLLAILNKETYEPDL